LQARRFEHYEVMLDADGRPIELGRGAMGVTYKALDVDLRCPVTLKVISEHYLGDESARLRFLREARAELPSHFLDILLGPAALSRQWIA
jgi:serine/threonine protein kinase